MSEVTPKKFLKFLLQSVGRILHKLLEEFQKSVEKFVQVVLPREVSELTS